MRGLGVCMASYSLTIVLFFALVYPDSITFATRLVGYSAIVVPIFYFALRLAEGKKNAPTVKQT